MFGVKNANEWRKKSKEKNAVKKQNFWCNKKMIGQIFTKFSV